MKTIHRIHALIPVLLCVSALAQEAMKPAWSTKLDHDMVFYGVSPSGDYCYGSNSLAFSLVSTMDGKKLWSRRFKDISDGLSQVDEQIPMWDANALFVFDRKNGNGDITACIDLMTGDFLWSTRKYQNVTDKNIIYIPEMEAFVVSTREGCTMVRARTGEEIWGTSEFKGAVGAYVCMQEGYLVMINYKPEAFESLYTGIRNQIVKINLNNGEVVWDETYTGSVEFKVITREPLVHLEIVNGKVLLYLNGMQVYDCGTGAREWSADWAAVFDKDLKVLKAPKHAKQYGYYGVIAEPIVSGNDVYVIETLKKKQFIRKYELNTGTLLWSSPEIPDATAIPGMFLVENTIVLQMGGSIECQSHEYENQTTYSGGQTYVYDSLPRINERWRVYTRNVGPYGLLAYHADNGNLLWQSERFKNGVGNAFPCGDHVIVCSGTALHSVDVATGVQAYAVKLKNDGIGTALKIMDYRDEVLVVGEKGVSGHGKSDGRLIRSGRWKTSEYMGMYGDTLLFQAGNTYVAAFDAETCGYRVYKPRVGCVAQLSDDGSFIYAWERDTIAKLAAR